MQGKAMRKALAPGAVGATEEHRVLMSGFLPTLQPGASSIPRLQFPLLSAPGPVLGPLLSQIFSSLAVLNLHHGFECVLFAHMTSFCHQSSGPLIVSSGPTPLPK